MAPFIIKGGGQFLEENVAVWHERGYDVYSDTHLQETENIYTSKSLWEFQIIEYYIDMHNQYLEIFIS